MGEQLIYSVADVLAMLDGLLEDRNGSWWDGFYADRAKPCPFFVEWPDENLSKWFVQGRLEPGRVLELGCGNGRNALYLTGLGAMSTLSTSPQRPSVGPRSERPVLEPQ